MMRKNLMMALVVSTGLMFGACGSKETKEAATETPAQENVINTTHAYVCPMNCENSARNEPGQCVVCGMDLVKNPNYVGADATVVDSTTISSGEMDQAKEGDDHNHDNHEGHNH